MNRMREMIRLKLFLNGTGIKLYDPHKIAAILFSQTVQYENYKAVFGFQSLTGCPTPNADYIRNALRPHFQAILSI